MTKPTSTAVKDSALTVSIIGLSLAVATIFSDIRSDIAVLKSNMALVMTAMHLEAGAAPKNIAELKR